MHTANSLQVVRRLPDWQPRPTMVVTGVFREEGAHFPYSAAVFATLLDPGTAEIQVILDWS
jgi:hypothetical protein